MDWGQVIYIICRLVLGAVAAFLAIMLWFRTRDLPWMLVAVGIIAAYVETVYSVLKQFGIEGWAILFVGSMPLMSILLSSLPMVFFIAAFAVMVARKYRRT